MRYFIVDSMNQQFFNSTVEEFNNDLVFSQQIYVIGLPPGTVSFENCLSDHNESCSQRLCSKIM